MVDILHITVSGKIVSKGMLLFGYSPLKSVLLSWPYWTFFSVGQISVWNSFCDMKPIHVCKKPWSRSYKDIFGARFIFSHFIFLFTLYNISSRNNYFKKGVLQLKKTLQLHCIRWKILTLRQLFHLERKKNNLLSLFAFPTRKLVAHYFLA